MSDPVRMLPNGSTVAMPSPFPRGGVHRLPHAPEAEGVPMSWSGEKIVSTTISDASGQSVTVKSKGMSEWAAGGPTFEGALSLARQMQTVPGFNLPAIAITQASSGQHFLTALGEIKNGGHGYRRYEY